MYVKCFESITSTKGVTGIVQQHGRRRPVAQHTVVRPVASNSAIGLGTRRQCHSVQVPGPPWWGGRWPEDRTREDSAIRRGGRRPEERTREDSAIRRGGRRPKKRTREDSAIQTHATWSTVKGWTTTWGEDTASGTEGHRRGKYK